MARRVSRCLAVLAPVIVASAAACGGDDSVGTMLLDGGRPDSPLFGADGGAYDGSTGQGEGGGGEGGADAQGGVDSPSDAVIDAALDASGDAAACNNYYVDPVNGNDLNTGCPSLGIDAGTSSCAFRTITRAVQVMGTACAPTLLHVIGPANVGAGESFP